jgi:hypothetical protein
MGFESGSISFRRFAVVGNQPETIDQSVLDRLAEFALRPGEVGVPEEAEYGWSGGRHVLDDQFSFENNVFADALSFALRIDTNKVPSELAKAYKLIEQDTLAKGNPSGFISKKQKKEAKETAQRKVDKELRSGKYRRSKLVSILWDLPSSTLYASVSGKSEEMLHEIFERTFDLTLQPLSAGALGLRLLEAHGKRRDYEDARPTRFVFGPEGESQQAEYPWVAKGPEAKDFYGNEFMLWLWQQADTHAGTVKTSDNDREVSILFDRTLDLDCVFGQSGRDSLRGTGVTHMPEALDALRSGKVPRKAGLIIDASGMQYSLTLGAETFGFGALKLPEVEEAENPRVVFEERVAMLREFCKMFDAMYDAFLKIRSGAAWEGHSAAIRKWITRTGRATAANPGAALAIA